MKTDKKISRDYRFIVFSAVAAYMAVMLFAEFDHGSYGRIIKHLGKHLPFLISLICRLF